MNSLPQIDILLTTYNGSRFLKTQLDSILNQTYDNWKIFVRDDNSKDSTLSILEEYKENYPKKIQIIPSNGKRLGSVQGFSELMKYSGSQYVMFCDQDDFWKKEKIWISFEKMRELEVRFSNIIPIMVFTDLEVGNIDLKVTSKSFWNDQKLEPSLSQDLYSILAQNVVTGCTMILNRTAKKLVYPIPMLSGYHDHWIAVNVCNYGKVGYVEKPTIVYRQHFFNELGAIKPDFKYFYKKLIRNLINTKDNLLMYKAYPFDVIIMKVIIRKSLINFKRLIKK